MPITNVKINFSRVHSLKIYEPIPESGAITEYGVSFLYEQMDESGVDIT